MRILFITKHNPFGASGGGTMASHAYLRAFSEICKGNIDICMADSVQEADPNIKYRNLHKVPERSFYSRMMSVFTGQMHRHTHYVKSLLEKDSKYDLCVFDHSSVAGSLATFVKGKDIKTLTIHHNYEPEYFWDNTSGISRMLFYLWVKKNEKTAYLQSNINLFLTKQDKDMFAAVYGKNNACNEVVGTFDFKNYEYTKDYDVKEHSLTFVISGSLSSYQTVDAISYFFSDLYGLLPKDCQVIIAGRNPGKEVINLCSHHANVSLIANPEDMNEVISYADVYLCATRIGGGLKLRVMDGLRNGLPVITHKCSARGFDMFYDKNCFEVFSTKEQFHLAINKIIPLVLEKKFEKSAIINLYKTYFSFDAGLCRMRELII